MADAPSIPDPSAVDRAIAQVVPFDEVRLSATEAVRLRGRAEVADRLSAGSPRTSWRWRWPRRRARRPSPTRRPASTPPRFWHPAWSSSSTRTGRPRRMTRPAAGPRRESCARSWRRPSSPATGHQVTVRPGMADPKGGLSSGLRPGAADWVKAMTDLAQKTEGRSIIRSPTPSTSGADLIQPDSGNRGHHARR